MADKNFSINTNLSVNGRNFTEGIDKAKTETKGLKEIVNNAGEKIKGTFSSFSGMLSPLGEQLGGLGGSIGGLGGSFSSLVPKITGVKTALAGIGIGLLITAIASLISWFKRTDEGADGLRKAFDVIKAVINTVLDKLSVLGSALVKLFSGDFSGAWKDIKEAMTGWGDAITKNISNANKLNDIQDELENRQEVYAKKRALLEVAIADLTNKAKDSEQYNATQRLKYTDQLKEKTTALYALDKDLKAQELKQLQAEQALQGTNQDLRTEANRKEAELISLNAAYLDQLTGVNKIRKSIVELANEEKDIVNKKQFAKDNPLQKIELKKVTSVTTSNVPKLDDSALLKNSNYLENNISLWGQYAKSVEYANLKMKGTQVVTGALNNALTNLTENGKVNFKSMMLEVLAGIRQILVAYLAEAIMGQLAGNAKYGLVGIGMAVAGIAATMAIASQVPKFETGGVVGGSSYYGDKILARVNSGELILNPQQQQNLYNSMSVNNNNSFNGNVEFEIKGDKLYGVLKNYNKKISSYS